MAEAHRRRFLECLGWAGTGLVWTVSGGVSTAALLAAGEGLAAPRKPAIQPFTFVQVSDQSYRLQQGPEP